MKKLVIIWALLCASAAQAQVAVAPMQIARQQFFNGTGAILSAGCFNFFATGTSTPQAIYADSTGTSQLSNPLTLDSTGSTSVWMTNTGYDVVANTGVVGQPCSSALGTQLWKQVNVNPFAIINIGSNYIVASGTSDPAGSAGELAYRTDIPCFRGFTTLWDCFIQLTAVQTLANKTIDVSVNTLKNSTNTAGHYPRNNGTQYVDAAIQSSDLPTVLTSAFANNASGTGTNLIAKLTGAPSTAVTVAVTDAGGAIGICVSGCGTAGTAQISTSGQTSCVFDGATVAGDYVQISTSVAGDCHDAGGPYPSGGQVLGRVLSTNGASGTYSVTLFGVEIQTAASSGTTTVYKTATTEAAASFPLTTLVTVPTSDTSYTFALYLTQTVATASCSAQPSVNAPSLVFTESASNTSRTASPIYTSLNFVTLSSGTATFAASLTNATSFYTTPVTFRAKASTPITLQITYNAGTGCGPGATYVINPVLTQN
jgi:hypothetical protein